MSLENLLRTLNNYHKRHGLTILYNDPESVWIRLRNIWLKISTVTCISMFYLASFERFTNNEKPDRAINMLGFVIMTEFLITETAFWLKRKKVLELVDWCRKVEVQKFESFEKPNDWFLKKRESIDLITRIFYGTFVMIVFVGPILQTYFYGDGYRFVTSFDFKNFSERNSGSIFLTEFMIFGPSIWFLTALVYYGFTFFILLSNYLVGQMELVQFYVEQLDLSDIRKLRNQLKDLTEMHLDVLRVLKKVSEIYLITLKNKEYCLYLYISGMVFGKELMSFMVPPVTICLILMVALYCHNCEKMMEAAENIGNAYYELEWITAPVVSKKLLLIAMQEPEQIRFGRVFFSDYASLERFSVLIRRAYDFSLALLKLSRK